MDNSCTALPLVGEPTLSTSRAHGHSYKSGIAWHRSIADLELRAHLVGELLSDRNDTTWDTASHELAVECGAEVVVSYNRRDLEEGCAKFGIRVVTPKAFLELAERIK